MKNRGNGLRWKQSGYFRGMASRIPTASGVYVIAEVRRVHGLVTRIDPLYVGKASNLRRRFSDHVSPWREHNSGMLSVNSSAILEFWFAEYPADQIDQLEKELIQQIEPSQNIIKYGGEKND